MEQAANRWLLTGRLEQLWFGAPPQTLMIVGGRGSGKTRTGAEWVEAHARGFAPFCRDGPRKLIALVGETLADVRDVMIEGPSGILSLPRPPGEARPRFEPSRRRVVWPGGAVAMMFSSEDPESLRGPQFDAAWSDELAKWKSGQATWDMLQFGLRLGVHPRQIVTTTPRPGALFQHLLADPDVVVQRMRMEDNSANLAASFVRSIRRRYGASRLGRQELDGELIEDREDALWSRDQLEACFVSAAPPLRRVVVAVDPPASSSRHADACGIVAAGLDEQGVVHVLADESRRSVKPAVWARRVVALYNRLEADCIVAEVNQGGEMVAEVIRTIDATVPVRAVRATRGKWLRAEPVAALYEQRRVRHAGRFPELEDEMCDFGPDGLSDGRSPDRLDALVWAVTELALKGQAEPRVREL